MGEAEALGAECRAAGVALGLPAPYDEALGGLGAGLVEAYGRDDAQLIVTDMARRLSWYLAHQRPGSGAGPTSTGFALRATAHELTSSFEPASLPRWVRTAAVVGLRNSLFEDRHGDNAQMRLLGPILVQAAAVVVNRGADTGSWTPLGPDPYAGLEEDFPRAFKALAMAGTTIDDEQPVAACWEPMSGPVPELPPPDPSGLWRFGTGSMPSQYRDMLGQRLAGGLPISWETLSFKHISRDVRLLCRIMELVMSTGGTIQTVNFVLANGLCLARRPDLDMGHVGRDDYARLAGDVSGWTDDQLSIIAKVTSEGYEGGAAHLNAAAHSPVRVDSRPGRNQPCPCGSAKKSKHCCWR